MRHLGLDLGLGVVLLVAGCAHVWPFSLYYLDRTPEAEVDQGEKAPAFALESVEGETVSLDGLRAAGKPVIVFYRGHF